MGQKNYQVTIHSEHCVDEPAVIARRLSALSERSEGEFLDGLLLGPVMFGKGLSYEEAAACKEMLGREGISAQIVRDSAGESESTAAEGKVKDDLLDVFEEIFAAPASASDNALLGHASEAVREASGGWEALFPELVESEAAGSEAAGVKSGREDVGGVKKRAVAPKISSWQPAMDTEEGVVARVPVVKKQAAKAVMEAVVVEGAGDLQKSRVFAGDVLAGAVVSKEEERGRYAPVGFDPRPAHVPVVAALFSGFAPGAGQVYNGQEGLALKYGLRFWLIQPWIASVRQAHAYGERVRDYQEPRPEGETFGQALRYLASWYLGVIGLVVAVVLVVGALGDRAQKPEVVVVPVEMVDVVGRAAGGVQLARISANTAVGEFFNEQNRVKQEFTMSVEERADRLYVIGYSYCAAHQYTLCEMAMRRVTSLGGRNRDAYRLQAWASMQIKQGDQEPMPEVSEVPTLFELELLQENDPDRDLVQPALDSMLVETVETVEKKADEEDEVIEIDE